MGPPLGVKHAAGADDVWEAPAVVERERVVRMVGVGTVVVGRMMVERLPVAGSVASVASGFG